MKINIWALFGKVYKFLELLHIIGAFGALLLICIYELYFIVFRWRLEDVILHLIFYIIIFVVYRKMKNQIRRKIVENLNKPVIVRWSKKIVSSTKIVQEKQKEFNEKAVDIANKATDKTADFSKKAAKSTTEFYKKTAKKTAEGWNKLKNRMKKDEK